MLRLRKLCASFLALLPPIILAVIISSCCLGSDFCTSPQLSSVERIICGSPRLLWDDRKLNALYSLARQIAPRASSDLKSSEETWLRQVRNPCSTPKCLETAYADRNKFLSSVVNEFADPLPKLSQWAEGSSRCPNCKNTFWVDLVIQSDGKAIGAWEGALSGNFLMGGLIDIGLDGKILDIRVLGGRGPSYTAGVALMVRQGGLLFVANMFPRSSIGMEQDYELFDDVTLKQVALHGAMSTDFGSPTPKDLADAWQETENAARERSACSEKEDIDVCIRRRRP